MASRPSYMAMSIIFDEASPDPAVALPIAASLGAQYVSVRNSGPAGSVKKFHELADPDINRIKELADGNGIHIASAAAPLGKVKFDAVDDGNPAPHVPLKIYLSENVPRSIETAVKVGAPMIRVFAGYNPRGTDRNAYFNQSVDLIGGIAGQAWKAGLVTGIEIEQDLACPDAESLSRLLNRLKEYADCLGIIWDGGNVVATGKDTIEEYPIIQPGIIAIHSKDLRLTRELYETIRREGRADEKNLKDFVPVGQGDANYHAIFGYHRRFKERKELLLRNKASGLLVPAFSVAEDRKGDYDSVTTNDLEPHLSEGGQFGGTSGPRKTGIAYRAAKGVAEKVGWDCIG